VAERLQVVYIPLNYPLDSARRALRTVRSQNITADARCRSCGRTIPVAAQCDGGQIEQGRSGKERPSTASVLFLARLLASALASQRCFHALFLAGFQVKGVALDLLDNVFLLHLALETAQSVLERLALLKSYFRQADTPPDSSGRTG
jgi:hypothetical protein